MSFPIGACGHLFPLWFSRVSGLQLARPIVAWLPRTLLSSACLASRCSSSLGFASLAVVLRCPCFSAALLRGLDADPLRLWWLEPVCSLAVSVFFGADIMASLGLSLLHRILLSWCPPFSFRCLWDVGLVFDA